MDKINKLSTERIIRINGQKISLPAELLNILFMEKEGFLVDEHDDMKLAGIGGCLGERISSQKLYMDSANGALDAIGKKSIKVGIDIFIKGVTRLSEYHRNINFDKIDPQLEFFKIGNDAIFFFNYKNSFEEKSVKLLRVKDIFNEEGKIGVFNNSNVYHSTIKHSSKFTGKLGNGTNIGSIIEINQFYDILSMMMEGGNTGKFSINDIENSNLLKFIVSDTGNGIGNEGELKNITEVEIAIDINTKGKTGFFMKKRFTNPSKYDINGCELVFNSASKGHLNVKKPTALSLVINEDMVDNILLGKMINDTPLATLGSSILTLGLSTFQEIAFYLAAHNELGSKELKEKIQLLEDRFIERSSSLFKTTGDKYEEGSFLKFLKPLK